MKRPFKISEKGAVSVLEGDEMPVQVFISYARDDDEPPPGPEPLPGFVTSLHEHLLHQLKQLGQPRPKLWRDTGEIERTDQFEPVIEQQIARSDFVIVVLSPNWLARLWCRRELESFRSRWVHEGESKLRHRILVVNKTHLDPGARPALLQGQEGHNFYALNAEQHEGSRERPFFVLGKIKDERFVQQILELASKLQRLACEISPAPPGMVTPASAPTNGRTIFVAQPADDMRQPYERILNELKGRGFAIVPNADVPNDHSAVAFIDGALTTAEISIHPLGEKRGYAPAEENPIVQLQLARAALRARGPDPGRDEDARPPFRRIVWAPKIVEDPDAARPAAEGERDPLAVLANLANSSTPTKSRVTASAGLLIS
ncbi:MAG TPA: toll/interleukin-1 receptor domain-containing protein [Roseiarcus sp.]